MATSVLGQISKRERLGPVSALTSLKGSDLSTSGQLGHVNLSQSSVPHTSSIPGPQVDISHGTAVLHGDGHPRNFKPIPGPLAENILQAPLGSLNYWRERAQD